jgi:membrane-associated phospholipid phosphatase
MQHPGYGSGMRALKEGLLNAATEIRRRRVLFLLIPIAVIACAALTIGHDVAWSDGLVESRTDLLRKVARRFSAFGDFQTGTLAVVAVVWIVGKAGKSERWRTAAMACLLAAILAGATATTLRTLTGRPRPSAGVADGFYGPRFDHTYHSFGSAHAATSLGTSTALAIAVPEIGIPVMVLSLGVPWSRYYMRDHYITDLIVGGGIGVWFGLAFGLAARLSRNNSVQPRINAN